MNNNICYSMLKGMKNKNKAGKGVLLAVVESKAVMILMSREGLIEEEHRVKTRWVSKQPVQVPGWEHSRQRRQCFHSPEAGALLEGWRKPAWEAKEEGQ